MGREMISVFMTLSAPFNCALRSMVYVENWSGHHEK